MAARQTLLTWLQVPRLCIQFGPLLKKCDVSVSIYFILLKKYDLTKVTLRCEELHPVGRFPSCVVNDLGQETMLLHLVSRTRRNL